MSAIAIAVIVFGASLVVLGAVALSGLGPLSSLRRVVGRFDDVRSEADRLRRELDVLRQRRQRLGRAAEEPEG